MKGKRCFVIIVRQPYEVWDQVRRRPTLAFEVSQLHHRRCAHCRLFGLLRRPSRLLLTLFWAVVLQVTSIGGEIFSTFHERPRAIVEPSEIKANEESLRRSVIPFK
jgi:hypothetical protein